MELSLMEKFSDPALITSLSTGEIGLGALITMIMGLGTTFVILILLWGIVALQAKIIGGTEKKKAESVASSASAPVAQSPAPLSIKDESGNEVTSPELVAAITAAIEAYESGGRVSSNLVIRKINRAVGQGTAWSKAGIDATISSRNI